MLPVAAEAKNPEGQSVGEYLSLLVQDVYGGPSEATYDAVEHTWTLCVKGLSENHKDFLEVLGILRAIAQYKDCRAKASS